MTNTLGMRRCLTLLLLLLHAGGLSAQARIWTSRDGLKLEGELVAVRLDGAHIRRAADAQMVVIPLDYFSLADQTYIRKQAALPPEANGQRPTPATTARTEETFPQGGLVWPNRVSSPRNFEITVLEENTSSSTYRYQAGHFIFTSDVRLARRVVAEFARIFEATYTAVDAMPLRWNLQPPPGGYAVRLFSERADYEAAGGTRNSGGVYMHGPRTIMVPLESLGVKRSSSGVTLDGSSNKTLVHEITHQVQHDWLNKMPQWIVEGVAEYMEKVPYERGTFTFSRLDPLNAPDGGTNTAGEALLIALPKLMGIDRATWSQTLNDNPYAARRYYYSSFLLFYYFAHLDGNGDGKRLWSYLRALESGQSEEEATALLMDGRDHETLLNDIRRAYRSKKVRIRVID